MRVKNKQASREHYVQLTVAAIRAFGVGSSLCCWSVSKVIHPHSQRQLTTVFGFCINVVYFWMGFYRVMLLTTATHQVLQTVDLYAPR